MVLLSVRWEVRFQLGCRLGFGWTVRCRVGHFAMGRKPRDPLGHICDWSIRQRALRKFHWTELSEQCPETTKWFKTQWPFTDYDRVRFMLIEPGGFIQPHADYDERRMAAFNIAVSNPPGVDFAMEEAGCIPWEPGDVRAIDIGRKHAVVNNGTEDRIHMIVHGKFNQNFKELLCRSYDKLIESLSN